MKKLFTLLLLLMLSGVAAQAQLPEHLKWYAAGIKDPATNETRTNESTFELAASSFTWNQPGKSPYVFTITGRNTEWSELPEDGSITLQLLLGSKSTEVTIAREDGAITVTFPFPQSGGSYKTYQFLINNVEEL